MSFSSGPDPKMVEKAKELCEDLLGNVKEQYEEFKARPPRQHYGGHGEHGGHGGGYQGRNYGDRNHGERSYGDRSYGDRGGNRSGSYGGGGGGGGGYGGYNSPAPGGAAASPAQPAGGAGSPPNDYAAQYAQYYGGQDPYAAYGGYAA